MKRNSEALPQLQQEQCGILEGEDNHISVTKNHNFSANTSACKDKTRKNMKASSNSNNNFDFLKVRLGIGEELGGEPVDDRF